MAPSGNGQSQRALATIGYEGAAVEDLIATLATVGVEVLIDVRDIAASRRKGFSKTALSAALESAGIDYQHLRGLGDPRDGRIAAREGRRKDFLNIFNAHLSTPNAKADMKRAGAFANNQFACLLCYERDPKECHRTIVADLLRDNLGFKVRHLGVRDGIAAEWTRNQVMTG